MLRFARSGLPAASLALALLLPAVPGLAGSAPGDSPLPPRDSAGLCRSAPGGSGVLQLAEVRRVADCDECRTSGRRAGYRQCCELVGGDYRCEWVRC